MADTPSPIICVTCKRSFPPDLTMEDSPRYFAQEHLLPRSDDEHSFKNEADVILGFIKTVTFVTRHCKEAEPEHYVAILDLLFQLSEEAHRRVALVDAAMREKWHRDHGHDVPTRHEGRA